MRGGTLCTIMFVPLASHDGTRVIPRVVVAAGVDGASMAPETPRGKGTGLNSRSQMFPASPMP
jgi:hypothetical protein